MPDPAFPFAHTLIEWHRTHGRHDLPWQRSRDPYRIWLSEIMLQQTQVDTVMPYYARFLTRFPDLPALAAADVDEVLGLWSGLGYYARARNLHKAAQRVMDEHAGRFPESAAQIAGLPGIGRSTAAAIAAFAFDERGAILDGNVKRVLCRVFGIEGFPGDKAVENRLWALAGSLLPERDMATYTQAQMDFGATLCTRARPACPRCPLAEHCIARRDDRVRELPTPRPRKARPHREVRVAVIRRQNRILLEKRPPSGLWGGLLTLPELPELPEFPGAQASASATGATLADWLMQHYGLPLQQARPLPPEAHAFTHFTLDLHPVLLDLAPQDGPQARPLGVHEAGSAQWVSLDALAGAALPAPVRRILDSLQRPSLF